MIYENITIFKSVITQSHKHEEVFKLHIIM